MRVKHGARDLKYEGLETAAFKYGGLKKHTGAKTAPEVGGNITSYLTTVTLVASLALPFWFQMIATFSPTFMLPALMVFGRT